MEALKFLLSQTRGRQLLLWGVVIFPFVSPLLIKQIAGLLYDWVYYSNYMSFVSLAFVVSSVALIRLARSAKGGRWKVLALGGLYFLIGIFLPGNRCQEYLVLREAPGAMHYVEDCSRTAVSNLPFYSTL